LGSNIRVDTRGNEVMRIVPRANEEVNEEWISDKARFSYDALKRQRLDKPMVRDGSGKLQETSWEFALDYVAEKLKSVEPSAMRAVAGKLSDAESMIALKDMMNKLGASHLTPEGMENTSADVRSSYLFNSNLVGVEDADFVLLIGTNPRTEAPVLNVRLRRAVVAGGVTVASVGPKADLSYPSKHLGDTTATLEEVTSGKHAICEAMKSAKNPMVIVGSELLRRPDSKVLLKKIHAMCDENGVVKGDWNGFNVLHDAGGTVGALDIGFVPGTSADDSIVPQLVYSLGAEEFEAPTGAFVVYQGHHGDKGAARADVVLPGAAYTEKTGTYVNTEGRAQMALASMGPVGLAKEDWRIIRALSEFAGVPLAYNTHSQVHERLKAIAPHFGKLSEVEATLWLNGATYANEKGKKIEASIPLKSSVDNFFMTDIISRLSATMAKCTEARASSQ
jgi:NADH dehydrogenase (ubiquinone) Fe-S protein 1